MMTIKELVSYCYLAKLENPMRFSYKAQKTEQLIRLSYAHYIIVTIV